jgi:hypothetical protein
MNRQPTKLDKAFMAILAVFFVAHSPIGPHLDHDEREKKIVLKEPKPKAEHKWRKIFHLAISSK